MSLASCSEDSISPDAGGDGDGDSTTEVPLAQVAKPKPNTWLAQEEYRITHFNSAQPDAFSSVSYTHLDVYKRQLHNIPHHRFSGLFRSPPHSFCLLYTSRCV